MIIPTAPSPHPRAWHGWGTRPVGSTQNVALHIGPLPDRKSIALYSLVGGVMYVHAYFRDETEARRALSVLDLITGGDPLEPGIWLGGNDERSGT